MRLLDVQKNSNEFREKYIYATIADRLYNLKQDDICLSYSLDRLLTDQHCFRQVLRFFD